jgi:hypothetical protein
MRMLFCSIPVLAMLLATTPALADIATTQGAKELTDVAAGVFSKSAIDRGIIDRRSLCGDSRFPEPG